MLAALLAFALASAAAASLGGLTVDNLGADANVVAACDTDGVTVNFGVAYQGGQYVVTDVTVGGIAAACAGQTLELTLFDSANTALGSGSLTVAGASENVVIASQPSAQAVTGVAVVISG